MITVGIGLLAAETELNQRSLSSFSIIENGIFQINGTTPLGQAVTASIGQCAGFCSRQYEECQGFLMRDSQCSTCGRDNDGSSANCQLITAPAGVVIFPGLNSSVNDYQLFYAEASTTVVTGNSSFELVLVSTYRQ
jgi:hypothetical protein